VLFTTIPYDEGCEVTVDGESAEILPVLNETLLAVRAGEGDHEISFRYRPDCVRYGILISLAAALVFGLSCLAERFIAIRKKKKNGTAEPDGDETESGEEPACTEPAAGPGPDGTAETETVAAGCQPVTETEETEGESHD
jgi:hypothetical protein